MAVPGRSNLSAPQRTVEHSAGRIGQSAHEDTRHQAISFRDITLNEIIVSTERSTSSSSGLNTIATSAASTVTTQSITDSSSQGLMRTYSKVGYGSNSKAPVTSNEPFKMSNEISIEQHNAGRQSAVVGRDSTRNIHKPVGKSHKVKKYCQGCTEKKAAGGYKVYRCTECEYEVESVPGADNGKDNGARGPSATPDNTPPTRSNKMIYCDECTQRKSELGDDGRRKNAKHKCAECRKLRDEARSSQKGSKMRSQGRVASQSVKQKRDKDQETGDETEEEDPYKYRPSNRNGSDASTLRAGASPVRLTWARQDTEPAPWVQNLKADHLKAAWELKDKYEGLVSDCTQLQSSRLGPGFQLWARNPTLSSGYLYPSRPSGFPYWVYSPPFSPNEDMLDFPLLGSLESKSDWKVDWLGDPENVSSFSDNEI